MRSRCQLRVRVYGLGCGGSEATTLERRLAAADGVLRGDLNPATKTAYIEFDPTATDARSLAHVVDMAGYRAGRPVEV